jgi:hypothetical protein
MKWEYQAVEAKEYGQALPDFLNVFGEDGWELIQCDLLRNMFVFKRPKLSKSKQEVDYVSRGKVD